MKSIPNIFSGIRNTTDNVRRAIRKGLPVILLAAIVLSLMGCAAFDERSQGELNAAYGSNTPKILASHAADVIAPGDTWQVYVKAEDPDGDMRFISVWVEAPSEFIPSYRIPVKAEQGGSISGYLALNSMEIGGNLNDYFSGWLRLRVSFEDRANHKTEPILYFLQFRYGAEQTPPPPGVFEERYLGRIPVPIDAFTQPPGGVYLGD